MERGSPSPPTGLAGATARARCRRRCGGGARPSGLLRRRSADRERGAHGLHDLAWDPAPEARAGADGPQAPGGVAAADRGADRPAELPGAERPVAAVGAADLPAEERVRLDL